MTGELMRALLLQIYNELVCKGYSSLRKGNYIALIISRYKLT